MLERQTENKGNERNGYGVDRVLQRKLGWKEILPTEETSLRQIRWRTRQVQAALRLGSKGDFIYDPKGELEVKPLNDEQRAFWEDFAGQKTNGSDKNSYPNADDIVLSGCMRRLDSKKYRDIVAESLASRGERLAIATAVLEAGTKKESLQPDAKTILVVAHSGAMDFGSAISGFRNHDYQDRISAKQKLLGVLSPLIQGASAAALSFATPYIGIVPVLAEIEDYYGGDKSVNFQVIDFNRCVADSDYLREMIRKYNPSLAVMGGLLSFDLKNLPKVQNVFSEGGVVTWAGGLAATLDPRAVAEAGVNYVSVGEAEGTVAQVLGYIESDTNSSSRAIFTRKRTRSEFSTYDEISGPKNVGLDVPYFVDRNNYYSYEHEKAGGLAQRLRLEQLMISEVEMGGKRYEVSSAAEQVSWTYGCPDLCDYCSTAIAHGQKMRRVPAASVALRIMATEAKNIAVIDQNFGAISRHESPEYFKKWMMVVLTSSREYHKNLIVQTGYDFFLRALADPELASLVEGTVRAALVGMEQPTSDVPGSPTKSSTPVKDGLEAMNKLKVVVWGTGVVGLDDISENEWFEWLDSLPVISIATLFPKVTVPGSPACHVRDNGDSHLAKYDHVKYDPSDLAKSTEIMRSFYSVPRIAARVVRMKSVGYTDKQIFAALMLNVGAMLAYRVGGGLKGAKRSMELVGNKV